MGGGKSSKVHRKGHKIDELKHHSRQHKKSKSPKKKRDRRNSSSGSSSETSGHGNKFEELLAAKRLEKIEQKKFEKKRQKELETPEQKRARRQAKKLQKEEKQRMDNAEAFPECIPYTDMNNPFNDVNLTEAFVWKKKLEAQGIGNISREKAEKLSRQGIYKNIVEMEQLRKNREAREAAREDLEMIERDLERRQGTDWRRTEDKFALQQAKLRSSIRIKEGRPEPIDHLLRYIHYWNFLVGDSIDNPGEFELINPLNYLKNCKLGDFEDLLTDIRTSRTLDGAKNNNYWDDLEMIIRNEVKKIGSHRTDESSMPPSVKEEVVKSFKNKTYEELSRLECQLQSRIKNASRGTDVTYWESVIELLRPFMAKQRLDELHRNFTKLKLKTISEEQSKEMAKHEFTISTDNGPSTSAAAGSNISFTKKEQKQLSYAPLPFTISEFEEMEEEQKEQSWQQVEKSFQNEQFALELYSKGCYSPSYNVENQAMPGIEILDEEEDRERLAVSRANSRNGPTEVISAKEQQMIEMAKCGMTNDEEIFAVEEKIKDPHYLWSDNYRPRKPRYLNRVHTGFDWNKYNQTHYDIDNPPPKIVQGYRFNIFYPDLLDQSKTPSFTLTKCEDPDFAIVRFKAGPPYEDIAFKVVNREWEINHKQGYKCQFQGGVFQLWFFFKRYRYRR